MRRKQIRIDLHIHSDRSDGEIRPGDVVRRAHAVGLDTIALTDHDSIGGLAEAERAGRELGVRIIPGVEMTATLDTREIHLLAYFPTLPAADDRSEGSLARALEEVQAARRRRLRDGIKALRLRGVLLRESDVLSGGCESFTRLHLARALLNAGYVRKIDEAFTRFLGDRFGTVPAMDIQPEQVIDLIHAHGGLAVWAHPDPEAFSTCLDRLVRAGLDGVETHNFRRPDTVGQFTAAVRERGLLATGGSDWHGGPQERTLGSHAIDNDLFQPFYRALIGRGTA